MSFLLPIWAAALALGILIGFQISLTGSSTLALALALVSALLAARAPRHLLLWLACSTAAVLLAGISLGVQPQAPADAPAHVRGLASKRGGQRVRVVGRVASAARLGAAGQYQDLSVQARLDGGQASRLVGTVILGRPPEAPTLHPGEVVLVRGKLGLITGNRNPGAPGSRGGRPHEPPRVRIRADTEDLVLLDGASSPPLLGRLRSRLARQLGLAVEDPDQRGLLGALIMGDRAGISDDLRAAFARAGTSHLLAISGLHLALVALGVAALSRRLLLWIPLVARSRDPGRLAMLPAAAAALFYTALTGAASPTARACVLVLCLGAARLVHRPPDLARPLSLAALLLLLLHPPALLLPGFQLSFIAVAGIALAARRFPRPPGPGDHRGLASRTLEWVKKLALASTAATLVTAPLVVQHFGQATVAGVAVNLVAIPWTSLVLLPSALLGAAAGQLWPPAGEVLLSLAALAAGCLIDLCGMVASWPVAREFTPPGWPLTLALSMLALGLLLPRRNQRRALVGAALLLAAVAALLPLTLDRQPPLALTFLDVGQGDSTFISTAGGFSMLVDGGGDPAGRADPGQRRVVPFLRARGIKHLDLVVATHPHADHTAGLRAVLQWVAVDELWVCWHEQEDPWLLELLRTAALRGVPVRRPRLFTRDGLTVRPIWPRGYQGACADPARGANDNSIVLRLELGQAAVLLPGDVERETEEQLVISAGGWLAADLLKAPHHGSGTSSSGAFLRAVSPRLGIISCGLHNSFGIPPPRILRRYRDHGIPLARVDLKGAIGVHLWPDGKLRWRALISPDPWRWLPR